MLKKLIRSKILVLSVLSLSFVAVSSNAADVTEKSEKNYSIMVNPLGLVLGVANANFNFGVAEKMTLGVDGSYLYLASGTATGVGGGARMNYYFTGPKFSDSWYVSPFANVFSLSVGSSSATSFGGGAIVGYQWLYESGFSMMLGLGLKYSSLAATLGGTDVSSLSGLRGTGEFSLGFVW